ALRAALEAQNSQKGRDAVPGSVESKRNAEQAGIESLTPREVQVLKCIAEGNSTKQVAVQLGIAFKTAACHRQHLMAKLGVHDTANLVRCAIRRGIAHA